MPARRLAVLVIATAIGCWTSARPAEPPRWRTAPVAELLPDGAWLEAVVVRGPIQVDAFRACLSDARAHSEVRTEAGHEVLAVSKDGKVSEWLVSNAGGGMVLGGSVPVVHRALVAELRPATGDPRLGPLIARARAGGELWAAALVPRDLKALRDVREMLGLPPTPVVSMIASVHVSAPYRIAIALDLESAHDAETLAAALETKRGAARDAVGPGLRTIVDAVSVHAEAARVTITGTPPEVDWLQAMQDVLAIAARFRDG